MAHAFFQLTSAYLFQIALEKSFLRRVGVGRCSRISDERPQFFDVTFGGGGSLLLGGRYFRGWSHYFRKFTVVHSSHCTGSNVRADVLIPVRNAHLSGQ